MQVLSSIISWRIVITFSDEKIYTVVDAVVVFEMSDLLANVIGKPIGTSIQLGSEY